MVTTRTTLQGAVALVALALVGAACNAVFGIDQATLDPSIANTANQAQPLSCDTYCATIMQNCTGGNQEYLSVPVCMDMCSRFEPGLANDRTGDSLSCRLAFANSAATDPNQHCRHAGPSGGGQCGDQPCNAFCLLGATFCTGDLVAYDGGEAECRTDCAKYTYLTEAGTPDLIADGPTLNCRLYHLESAYDPSSPAAKTTHCPHTGKVSATCF